MTLITQIIIAVVTFGALMLKKYVANIREEESNKATNERDEEKIKKYNILSKMFLVISVVGIVYFIFYLIISTPFTFWNIIKAMIKMAVFAFITLIIIIYEDGFFEDLDEGDIQAFLFFSVIASVIVFACMFGYDCVQEAKYEKNIVEIEEIQYNKKEFKLSKEFNVIDSEDNEILENSVSEYFDCEIYRYNSGSISIEYSICYVDEKGDLIFKELDEDNTKLMALKKDETPYLEIKTYTKYAIDNNKNPPEQIVRNEKTEYVIHVLQEDIDKVLNLEKEE